MREVDAEIRKIINEQYEKAKQLLEEHRDKVEVMTQALLEWETIDELQINAIMDGRKPTPPDDLPPPTSSSGSVKPRRRRRQRKPVIGDENTEAA